MYVFAAEEFLWSSNKINKDHIDAVRLARMHSREQYPKAPEVGSRRTVISTRWRPEDFKGLPNQKAYFVWWPPEVAESGLLCFEEIPITFEVNVKEVPGRLEALNEIVVVEFDILSSEYHGNWASAYMEVSKTYEMDEITKILSPHQPRDLFADIDSHGSCKSSFESDKMFVCFAGEMGFFKFFFFKKEKKMYRHFLTGYIWDTGDYYEIENSLYSRKDLPYFKIPLPCDRVGVNYFESTL